MTDFHCPECGTTDLTEMSNGNGAPMRCYDCGVNIVEFCGIDCEHLWNDACAHPDFNDIEADTAHLVALFAVEAM